MSAITLIGPGRHGTAIASLFASHGTDVTLFHHKPAKAEAAAAIVRRVARDAQVNVATDLRESVHGAHGRSRLDEAEMLAYAGPEVVLA